MVTGIRACPASPGHSTEQAIVCAVTLAGRPALLTAATLYRRPRKRMFLMQLVRDGMASSNCWPPAGSIVVTLAQWGTERMRERELAPVSTYKNCLGSGFDAQNPADLHVAWFMAPRVKIIINAVQPHAVDLPRAIFLRLPRRQACRAACV